MTHFLISLDDGESGPVAMLNRPRSDVLSVKLLEGGTVPSKGTVIFDVPQVPHDDAIASDTPFLLFSERFKSLTMAASSASAGLDWLSVLVVDSAGTCVDYFIPDASDRLDLVDINRSITARNGFVVKPVLNGRASNFDFFCFGGGRARIIVSQELADAIVGAGLKGIGLTPVAIA